MGLTVLQLSAVLDRIEMKKSMPKAESANGVALIQSLQNLFFPCPEAV